jgi:integrase
MARWTPSDLQTFLDFTAVERLGLPLPFAPTTGMRRGEVCGVRWSDVDLDKGRVEVRQQIPDLDGEQYFAKRTKN